MHQDSKARFRVPDARTLGLALLGLVAVLMLGWTLRAMAAVAVPMVFAILATLLVAPLDLRLARMLPDKLVWLAHLASVLTLLGLLMLLLGALGFAAQQVLQTMPNLSDEVAAVWSASGENGAKAVQAGASSDTGAPFVDELRRVWQGTGGMLSGWLIDKATALAQATVTMTGTFATSALLILFIAFMALNETGQWRGKLAAAWSRPGQEAWIDSLTLVSQRLRQFLVIRSAVGVLQGLLYVGWLALFGIDLLFVWGMLTFVLTYIPTLGSVIAGTLPVLYALITTDPWTALAVAAGIFVIEQVVGNYVDPMLLGRRLVISPLVILVSLLFWGWYWGVAGAFLATPITLSLLIVFNHFPPLRPVALLLSNQTEAQALDEALSD